MRLSVPTFPAGLVHVTPSIPKQVAIARIAEFLSPGEVLIITGAGVSVDSGIRAYRGQDGRYLNPDYKPIFVVPRVHQ
jgi:hypothetical protein